MSRAEYVAASARESVDKLASVYWAARAPHVLRHLRLRRGERVLDLGCNTGLWSRHLAAAGARVVGVDVHLPALQMARRSKAKAARRPRYLLATAESLPLADNSFDATILLDVLDGVPDNLAALREIHRVLKPGGRLVMTGISRTRRAYPIAMSFDGFGERHGLEDTRALMREAGFAISAEFSFYQKFGLFSRGAGQLAHQTGIGKIPLVNLGIGLTLAGVARLDQLVARRADDTGIGFVGVKHA